MREPSEPGLAIKEHIHYLDWLKVLIVYGIFVFHVSLVFAGPRWLVSNHDTSLVLSAFAAFCFPWGIPAMFLIAGADSWFGLRSHSQAQFVRGRFLRLVLPLAAGILLLSPMQRFVTSANPPPPIGAVPGFYADFFRGMRLDWTPEWLSRYGLHLWFLGYLFAISAFCAPGLAWLRVPRGRALISRVERATHRRGGILLFAVPLVLSQLALRQRFPAYQDWADIATYTLVFMFGAVLIADRRFEAAIRRDATLVVGLGIGSTLALGALMLASLLQVRFGGAERAAGLVAYDVLWSLNIWCWLVGVLYLGIRWLNFPNRIVSYANESTLPFYVIHHPVVVTVASVAVGWSLPVWPKFAAILVVALTISLAIYEFLVRRWDPVRILFGLKPRRAGRPRPGSANAAAGDYQPAHA
jgi:glucans biosynthesis protein C